MTQQEKFKSDFLFQKYHQQINQILGSLMFSQSMQRTKAFELLSETQKRCIEQQNQTKQMVQKSLSIFKNIANLDIKPIQNDKMEQIIADLVSSSVVYDQTKKRKDIEADLQAGNSLGSYFINYLATYTNIIDVLTQMHKSQQQDKLNNIETEYLKQSTEIHEIEDILHTDCCFTGGLLTKQCLVQHEINRVQEIVQKKKQDTNKQQIQQEVDKLYNQLYQLELQDKIKGINQRYVQLFQKQYQKNCEKKIDFEDLHNGQQQYNQTCSKLLAGINSIQQQLKTFQTDECNQSNSKQSITNISITNDINEQEQYITKILEAQNKLQRLITQCMDNKQQDNPVLEALSLNVNMLELLHSEFSVNALQYVQNLTEYNQNVYSQIQTIQNNAQQRVAQHHFIKFLQNINIENIQSQFSASINEISNQLSALQSVCQTQEQKINQVHKQREKLQQNNSVTQETNNLQEQMNLEDKNTPDQQNEPLNTYQLKEFFDTKLQKLKLSIQQLIQQKKDEIQSQKQNQIIHDQIANYFVDDKIMNTCMKLFDLQYCQECGRKQIAYLNKKTSFLLCDKCARKIQNYTEECIKCQQL